MGCCSDFIKVNTLMYPDKSEYHEFVSCFDAEKDDYKDNGFYNISSTSHVWLLGEYYKECGCENEDTMIINTQEDYDKLIKWFKSKLSITFLEAGSYNDVYELEKLYSVYEELIEEEFDFEEECLLFWHGW